MRRLRFCLITVAVLLQGVLSVSAVAHAAEHLGMANMQLAMAAHPARDCDDPSMHGMQPADGSLTSMHHTSCCAAGHCDCGGGSAPAALPITAFSLSNLSEAVIARFAIPDRQPAGPTADHLRPPILILS